MARPAPTDERDPLAPYLEFDRARWAALRAATPLTLTEDDLAALRGVNERVSLAEVVDVHLPLSRLLDLRIRAHRALGDATARFLGDGGPPAPYVVAIGGSVAVGKSTVARIVQALLARWPARPRVDLVTTDGFLYPNRVLEERGLLARKGFPESYDLPRLVRFLAEVKAGRPSVAAPVYSHLAYDVLPGEAQLVERPDVLVVEGLNVLQAPRPGMSRLAVSDFFDFSIYVDADEADIARWYVERFLTLRATAFRAPGSYFHRYAVLDDAEARATAAGVWRTINAVNLAENIRPTRARASLVLEKGPDHLVRRILLRRR
ncbi:MAG TPA: type I pantothenate kinase [Actinomycetota bacterium]|nr:type I pantothenate kinase [Actinomycetota bacterium]